MTTMYRARIFRTTRQTVVAKKHDGVEAPPSVWSTKGRVVVGGRVGTTDDGRAASPLVGWVVMTDAVAGGPLPVRFANSFAVRLDATARVGETNETRAWRQIY